jgi:hypothetical protein
MEVPLGEFVASYAAKAARRESSYMDDSTSSVQFWWFGERVIPVLIPNTAVKPLSGDGTHRNRWGE